MTKMGKSLFILLLIVAVIFLGRNFMVKLLMEKGTQAVTGLQLSVGSVDLDLANSSIEIQEMKLLNPGRFMEKTMLDMPEIFVATDPGALLLQGKLRLPEVRIHLQEFDVVKNAQGELNLDTLKAIQPAEQKSTESKKEPQKAMPMQIDKLTLRIDRVFYKDYSKGTEPSIKEFKININQSFENITDPNMLVSVIVAKALMSTTIGNLTGFDVSGLQDSVSSALSTSQEAMGQLSGEAAQSLSSAKTKTQETAGQARETLSSAVSGLKEKFKGFSS